MGIGSLIGGVASGIGGLFGSSAASKAAEEQAATQRQALALQQQMFQQTQQNLSPYMAYGQQAMGNLSAALPYLTSSFNPTMAQLEATPGYQFTLDQGLKSTQNSFAAQGLGSSGAALKGAAQYASGLASQTYQQQFQNDWAQKTNIFNMLNTGVNQGQSAAAGLSSAGQGMANSASNIYSNIGNALASGTLGSAQSLIGGLQGVGNSLMMYNMLGGGGGSSGSIGNMLNFPGLSWSATP